MKTRKLTVLLICLAMIGALGFGARGVKADEPYTYTVRVFAGAQGTFEDGSDMVAVEGLEYGERVNLDPAGITLPDGSKYYAKGFREAGLDNSEITNNSFTVTRDIDLVVGYGVLYRAVAYTVNYKDEAGAVLAPSRTYYGNPGDKPVVAHLYVEGYQPQAYNLTRTLSEDPAENVFDFVYVKADPVQVVRESDGAQGQGGGSAGNPAAQGTPQQGNVPAGQSPQGGSSADAQTGTEAAASAGTRRSNNGVIVLSANAAAPGVKFVTADGRTVTPVEIMDLDTPVQQAAQAAVQNGQAAQQAKPAQTGRKNAGVRPWVVGAIAGGSMVLAGGVILAVTLIKKKKES